MMKTCLTILALIICVGCGRESEPGGPGAAGIQAPGGLPANSANTFTIVVPAGTTHIAPGETYVAVVEINRRPEFHEEVAFEIAAPPGVSINPQQAVVSTAQDELRISITAAPEAQPGPAVIQLMAVPASGQNPIQEEFEMAIEIPEG